MLRRIVATGSFCYIAALRLAVFVYFYGLDSQHIRATATRRVCPHGRALTGIAGHLLPLRPS